MTAEQETAKPKFSLPRLPKPYPPYLWQMGIGLVAFYAAAVVGFGAAEGPTTLHSARVLFLGATVVLGLTLIVTGFQACNLWLGQQLLAGDLDTNRAERRQIVADRARLQAELAVAHGLLLNDPTEPGRDELHATLIRLFTDFGALDANQWAGLMLDELPVYGLRLVADHGPVPFVPVLDELGSPKSLGELLESQFGGGKGAAMVRTTEAAASDDRS